MGAANPTTVDPSGQTLPIGDLAGWHQVFADDFSTSVPIGGFSGCRQGTSLMTSQCSGLPSGVATKWWAYPDNWPDTTHNGRYYPSQDLSIHNGTLDQYLHTSNGIHMVSAAVPKIPGGVNNGGLRYGAYAVRFQADLVHGYKTAWLLWPDSEVWPQDGEIDYPEGDLDSTFDGFMHHMGATAGNQQDAYTTGAGYGNWHTAVIEWAPGMCRFILDGRIVGTSTQFVPSTPMHWVLQTETATDGTVPSSTTTGHVRIDWVAAYAPVP
ncbi:MAG: glycoside hydrolase family 16 protein [Solirubrobacteraceae bacterium]